MNEISNKSVRGRYQYFVENIEATNENPLIRLWLALPMNRIGQQVSVSSIKPPPQQIIKDDINGNVIIFWEIAPSTKSLTFQYDFEVLATDIEFDIDPHNIKPYDTDSEQYRYYTKSEPWIELSPEIRQKAREIIQTETNPYLCAKLFYDWIINNMSYVYPKVEDRGAQKSFTRLSGDCGEFSFVFIALCRKDKEFASSYYQSDDLLSSERDLLNLTKIIPDALVCWFYLGQVYLNLSKWDEAIACFRNSLTNDQAQLQPEVKVWAYNLLGTSLLKANNPTEARKMFEAVLALNCDYQDANPYALDGIAKTEL